MTLAKDDLSFDLVNSLIRYDPDTGKVYRKARYDMHPNWNEWHNKHFADTEVTSHKKDGYIMFRSTKRDYPLHRLIWLLAYGCYPKNQIDHINGDKLDNRLCNLREATPMQNIWNVFKHFGENLKGTSPAPTKDNPNRWRAQMMNHGVRHVIGYYPSEEAAHEAYSAAVKKFRGEFANVD